MKCLSLTFQCNDPMLSCSIVVKYLSCALALHLQSPSTNSVFEVSRIRAGSGDSYAQFGLGGLSIERRPLCQWQWGGGGGEGARVGRALHKGEPLQICLGSGTLLVVGG